MAYPPESVTAEEQEVIFKIRQLIGDEKEVFVDDVRQGCTSNILANGTMYQLEEPKGYPLQILINGVEASPNPTVVGYKILQFASPVLVAGANLVVLYEHFRHSDIEIIDTYDSGATLYLVNQCGLTVEDLGLDLLTLSTAFILLTKDLSVYAKSAVSLEDSDSKFDASARGKYIKDLLDLVSAKLKEGVEAKTRCKMYSLPVYKVE